ncbi:unnamed protein product [Ilex paraguariensis]|uniref:Translation elongation factor EFTs/EF1B dimerisation domain-containing protein n=1 Tax=Ilex paraguariensis TaxID=185542 RepID=A0ABC8T2T6_9AQUA
MKQKIKKLDEKVDKDSIKITEIRKECEESTNLIPQLEEDIPKLQKLFLDEEKFLEEIKENSKGVGRIAAILSLEVEDQNASLDALQRVGSELAMHVVAAKPLFMSKDLVSSDAIENEREILKSQSRCNFDFSASGVLPIAGRLLLQQDQSLLPTLRKKFVLKGGTKIGLVFDDGG